MNPHHNVKRQELFGQIDSSLNYSRQMLSRKNVSTEDKIAFSNILDHLRYYQSKKVDSDFMIFAVKYHLDKAIERSTKPKTVLSYDKVQSNIANGEIKVLSRINLLTE